MLRGLFSAASGMTAQQLMVDNISNNLANVNTAGFKKRRINFQDLLYQTIQQPGAVGAGGGEIPAGMQIGHGTRPVSIQPLFTPGAHIETGNKFDMAIQGEGFFEIQLPDKSIAYTRDGTFTRNSAGDLVTSDGYSLTPSITIGDDVNYESISVAADGTVSATKAGGVGSTTVGNVKLANFINPAGLIAQGSNLFLESDASGNATEGTPGEKGLGQIRQGFIEVSNVQVVEEMVNLIIAQRAYEVNSKSIQTADEMLQQANNIRR